jgi:hypothetical protein
MSEFARTDLPDGQSVAISRLQLLGNCCPDPKKAPARKIEIRFDGQLAV